MSDGKGKGETQGVMSCSSLTAPSARATNYMQDMQRMKHSSFYLSEFLPGISSAMEMTVTLHQPPAFCQVRISSQSGKINSSQMFRHFSHEICHIISSFLFWVFSSTNIDSPEQIQLFWLTTSSGRQCPSPAEYLMIVVICGTHSRVETLLV